MKIVNITKTIEYFASLNKMFFFIIKIYYQKKDEKEIDLANISSNDHVLCVGGGICPFTAIIIHYLTKSKVSVMDNDVNCSKKCHELIIKLGLENFITIINAEANSFSYEGYSVVHLALQLDNQKSIFAKVIQSADANTKILIRSAKPQLRKYYSSLEFDNFKHKSKQSFFTNTKNTYLHIKN